LHDQGTAASVADDVIPVEKKEHAKVQRVSDSSVVVMTIQRTFYKLATKLS